MRSTYRLIWISSALAILGMTLSFAVQPTDVPPPEPMKRYTAGDRSVRILHPGNWKAVERSSPSVETDIEFRPTRSAKMTIAVDLQNSLLVDVMRSTDTQNTRIAGMIPGGEALMASGTQVSPLVVLHAALGAKLKRESANYPDFKDGKTIQTQIGGKEALVTTCTWLSPGIFGSGQVAGRRVTLLSGDHEASVVYGCPREIETTVLPVFDKMLYSIEMNVQGGGR